MNPLGGWFHPRQHWTSVRRPVCLADRPRWPDCRRHLADPAPTNPTDSSKGPETNMAKRLLQEQTCRLKQPQEENLTLARLLFLRGTPEPWPAPEHQRVTDLDPKEEKKAERVIALFFPSPLRAVFCCCFVRNFPDHSGRHAIGAQQQPVCWLGAHRCTTGCRNWCSALG
jgi:hypothetical protein